MDGERALPHPRASGITQVIPGRHVTVNLVFGECSDGMLEMLEFFIVCRTEGPDVLTKLAQEFGTRSDLPGHLSKLVLTELLWRDMFEGRWDGAAARARHLLAVADAPEAEAALWALALKRGDRAAARNHLERVKLPTVQRARNLCMGSVAIGAWEQARGFLEEIRQADPAMAQRLEPWLAAREAAV